MADLVWRIDGTFSKTQLCSQWRFTSGARSRCRHLALDKAIGDRQGEPLEAGAADAEFQAIFPVADPGSREPHQTTELRRMTSARPGFPNVFCRTFIAPGTHPFSDASGVIHLIRRIRSAVRFV